MNANQICQRSVTRYKKAHKQASGIHHSQCAFKTVGRQYHKLQNRSSHKQNVKSLLRNHYNSGVDERTAELFRANGFDPRAMTLHGVPLEQLYDLTINDVALPDLLRSLAFPNQRWNHPRWRNISECSDFVPNSSEGDRDEFTTTCRQDKNKIKMKDEPDEPGMENWQKCYENVITKEYYIPHSKRSTENFVEDNNSFTKNTVNLKNVLSINMENLIMPKDAVFSLDIENTKSLDGFDLHDEQNDYKDNNTLRSQRKNDSNIDTALHDVSAQYQPDKAVGQMYIVPMSGYYCCLCYKFYQNETLAKVTHCKSLAHLDKLKEILKKKA